MSTSRFNWMNIALGGFFTVCLLLAVLYGVYQRGKALTANDAAEATTKQVAIEEENLRRIKVKYVPLVEKLGAEDNGREDHDFYAILTSMMLASNVKQVSAQRVALETLPTIGTGAASVKPTDVSSSQSEEEKAKALLPSLENLPLGTRAVTTRVEVQGTYLNLRNFIGQIHNYRFQKRALNLNSLKILFADDKGTLQATMNVTRFIYPKQAIEPVVSTDAATEAIRRPTSEALEMARPDKPAVKRPTN